MQVDVCYCLPGVPLQPCHVAGACHRQGRQDRQGRVSYSRAAHGCCGRAQQRTCSGLWLLAWAVPAAASSSRQVVAASRATSAGQRPEPLLLMAMSAGARGNVLGSLGALDSGWLRMAGDGHRQAGAQPPIRSTSGAPSSTSIRSANVQQLRHYTCLPMVRRQTRPGFSLTRRACWEDGHCAGPAPCSKAASTRLEKLETDCAPSRNSLIVSHENQVQDSQGTVAGIAHANSVMIETRS